MGIIFRFPALFLRHFVISTVKKKKKQMYRRTLRVQGQLSWYSICSHMFILYLFILYFASLNYNKTLNLAVGYGQSDRRKAVCCSAGAKIYCSRIGSGPPPQAFSPVGSVATSAEVQRPEHEDAFSFIEEAKNVHRMYECFLPYAYVYQWCL